jgi:hypothetical protein
VIQSVLSELREEAQRVAPVHGPTQYVLDDLSNSRPFYHAAWQMVNRGMLVPMPFLRRGEPPKFTGDEFQLTDFGVGRLLIDPDVNVTPTQYTRFGRYLHSHAGRFRPSYHTRSQEAVACYRAKLYFATCAMAGAAAESILLSLAVAASQSEAEVLREYMTSGGAVKIRKRIARGANAAVAREIDNISELLKYWRDESTHASSVDLNEESAYQALLLLWRLARFVDTRWHDILPQRDIET